MRRGFALTLTGVMLVCAGAGPAATGGHERATCLYVHAKADVLGTLNATTAEQAARHGKALRESPACGAVSSPDPIERGMLAEAALADVPAAASLGPLAPEPAYKRDWFAATGRDAGVDEMAVCMAARHPIGIRKMIGTAPGSAEERAVMDALIARIGPCLPQGGAGSAPGEAFRAALAEAFYHRATSPVLAAK